MAKYAKLGDKATSFSDPTSRLVLKNKDVVELSAKHLSSKRVKKAINGGHLSLTDKEEYEDFLSAQESKGSTKEKEEDTIEDVEDIETVDYSKSTEKDIKKALTTNQDLINNIVAITENEEEPIEEEDIKDLKKDDLVEIILNGYELEEEE